MDVGHNYVKLLVEHFLFENVYDDDGWWISVHDLVHEIEISIFVFPIGFRCPNLLILISCHNKSLREVPYGFLFNITFHHDQNHFQGTLYFQNLCILNHGEISH